LDDDEDENVNIIAVLNNKAFSVTTNDGVPTLKEAKRSEEWPEWERAIKAELA
jgi:hypothetical protein